MKCHYYYDPKSKKKIHIPFCWPAIMGGPKDCICRDYPDTFEEFENMEYNKRVSELKSEIKELEKYNAEMNRTIKNLLKRKRQ